ncbi:hypothetical protein CYANOKiyG1_57690 [Okeania sp. KiyG1]|nr:hypothetical protein CYANOKiyG1_57690 [Okeania sp. KiyG1]
MKGVFIIHILITVRPNILIHRKNVKNNKCDSKAGAGDIPLTKKEYFLPQNWY